MSVSPSAQVFSDTISGLDFNIVNLNGLIASWFKVDLCTYPSSSPSNDCGQENQIGITEGLTPVGVGIRHVSFNQPITINPNDFVVLRYCAAFNNTTYDCVGSGNGTFTFSGITSTNPGWYPWPQYLYVVWQHASLSNLQQFESDGVTVIPSGGAIPENTVVLAANVVGAADNTVQLQVEVEPNNIPFSGIPTLSSSFVLSGDITTITVPNILDGQYHWQARAVDSEGNTSPWSSGSNFVIDTMPPTISYNRPSPYYIINTSAIFSFYANDNGGTGINDLSALLDGKLFDFGPTVGSVLNLDLSVGTHTIIIKAKDYAGNITTSDTLTYTVPAAMVANGSQLTDQSYIGGTIGTSNGIVAQPIGAGFSDTVSGLDFYVPSLNNLIASWFKVDLCTYPSSSPSNDCGQENQIGITEGRVSVGTGIRHVSFTQPLNISPDNFVILRYCAAFNDINYSCIPSGNGSFTFGGVTSTNPGWYPWSQYLYIKWQHTTINGLAQYEADGITPLGTSATNTIVLSGNVVGSIDPVQLQVEIEPSGAAFIDQLTASSSFVSSGSTATITISDVADGDYHWQARAMDSGGIASPWLPFSAVPTNTDFVIDTTPPVIAHTAIEPQYILNGTPLQFQFSATDNGGVGLSNLVATLDGVEFSSGDFINFTQVGVHTIIITAKDAVGNISTSTNTYDVAYNFGGFLPPIQTDGSGVYKLKRSLAVKFQLTDANGQYVDNAVARLLVTKVEDGILGTVPIELSTSTTDIGGLFKYDPISNQYVYRLDTGSLTTGTWQLTAVLDDGTSYSILISLR
ncbi:MAG: PxKF domain-containing protein [Patescibacteria group bacterium]|nr:PxKF domain-containing protein [Patescibacteria group bacterium]MDE2015609.1 PxKF domain-containing protein [Patescibacteria group bacterium]MDE2226666.1 PxKF domain-containing protein [Patescibacteria group bacterium]